MKTDGYGHGAVPIACMLDDDPDVWGYATATLEEAVELHRAGIKNRRWCWDVCSRTSMKK